MAPSCALDEEGSRVQLERYRTVGRASRLIERSKRRLVVDVDERLDSGLVQETISIERECCPFFTLDWNPRQRRLTISVPRGEQEPALDAIAFALGLDAAAPGAATR